MTSAREHASTTPKAKPTSAFFMTLSASYRGHETIFQARTPFIETCISHLSACQLRSLATLKPLVTPAHFRHSSQQPSAYFHHPAPPHTSPKGATHHSEGLLSLGEATLVPGITRREANPALRTPHAHQQRLQKAPPRPARVSPAPRMTYQSRTRFVLELELELELELDPPASQTLKPS